MAHIIEGTKEYYSLGFMYVVRRKASWLIKGIVWVGLYFGSQVKSYIICMAIFFPHAFDLSKMHT